MTTALRTRLSISALAAASSFIALSAPAQAQSVCSATTAFLVNCTDGGATATIIAGATVLPSLEGLQITSGALPMAVSGTITTATALPALAATTTGDLTITAGANGPVNLTTTGGGIGAQLTSTGNATNATLGTLTTVGGSAVVATGGTSATVTTGAINSTNLTLASVPVLGGSAGAAAVVAAGAGPAVLTVNGNLTATGAVNPLIGAIAYSAAPAASAATTINGAVSVTGTGVGNTAFGAAAISGLDAAVAVTGPVLVTSTGAALGLAAAANTGAASVTAGGNLTARGTTAIGVIAQGTTVSIAAPNATITATDTDTGGVDAVGIEASAANALTINVGQVVSSGEGIVAGTTGGTNAALNVTVKGVQAGLNGVTATGTGTTPVTVTATAPITIAATGGVGVIAAGVDGAVTVTEVGVTGGTGGVLATTSGTGAVTVNANGANTTAIGGDAIAIVSGGAATTNVGAGASVTGQGAFDAIDTTSAVGATNTVNIAGTVAATGTGVAVRATGGPATVNVNSGGALNGALVLTGGADTLNVNAGGTFGPTGTVAFGAGNDTLNVRTGGTLQLGTNSTLTGLETLNNSGTVGLTGTVSLAGLTTLTNTGTVSATGGATVLTGLPTFTNTGTISMVDGAADDVLTLGTPLATTNYVGGANAQLALDVNGALTAADRLVITGTASGSTVVDVNIVGGAMYNPTGVTLVTTTGATANGAFTLNPNDVQQGFLNAGLVQTGGTTRLVTTLDSSVTDLGLVYTLGRDMWYQSFDAYDDAVRGRHAGALTTGNAIGMWGQMYRSRDRYGDAGMSATTAAGNTLNYSNRVKTDRTGAQLGVEFRGSGFVIGATGGYEWADVRDNPASVITAEGYNYGAYGLLGMANGLYAGVIYKRDDHHIRFVNPGRGIAADFNNAHSDGVDGEVGFKGDAGSIGFDFQGGLSYVKTKIGSYSAQGLDFNWNDNTSLRGRLGGRVIFPQALGAFVGAKVYHEFRDDRVFNVSSGGVDVADITMPHRGTWVRLEGGLDSFGIKGAVLTVWGDVGDAKSIGGRLGFRF